MSDDELKKLYKKRGLQLHNEIDAAHKESKKILQKGLKKLEKETTSLPDWLKNRIMSTKVQLGYAPSLLPESAYEKPRFRGKKKFYQRLAAEILDFGLAYQRAYGTYPTLQELANAFLSHRPWWQCTVEDINSALKLLEENSIISHAAGNENRWIFEPIELSQDIRNLILLAAKYEKTQQPLTFDIIKNELNWKLDKITLIINRLKKEGKCVQKEDELWFPILQNEMG